MPVWVDLSEHQVSLNVYNSPSGKRLILRPLTPQSQIPPEIIQFGFEQRGESYERSDLRFSLQDIQRLFPQAKSREFPMSEIFYAQPSGQELANLEQGMVTVVDVATELGGSLSSWEASDEQTIGQWRYSNLTIGDTQIRVAVSQGGVVQINRDPFTKEGRELHVTRERILASVKAALPPVLTPMPTVDASTEAEDWLERIMGLPDDQIRELAKIVGTPAHQHSHWRSFTEIDIHSLDNEKIRSGFEQLARIAPDVAVPASASPPAGTARAPWHVTKTVFLGESRFESSGGEHGQVIFDDIGYRTSEKTPAKAKAEVHERLVTESLHGRTAGPFPLSLPPFEVMLDYPAAIYRVNQRAEKNLSRLLSQLGVGAKLIAGKDAYLKLHNPPYMDLVIERHPDQGGDRLFLTHYYRSNGDSCLDCEMVFSIRSNGTLRLVETATQDPFRGGEHRGIDVSFANMFSKNLLDQKFGTAMVMWPSEERESKDPHYFNAADELYEARLEEYMRKVLLKGEEFSTLVFATDEDDGTIVGEKFISGSNKASITKAQNVFMEKYGNISVLGHGTMFAYILAKDIKTTRDIPVKMPEWLVEGRAYDVAIMSMNGMPDNPARYWDGAVFKRMEKSFAGNGAGSEFVATFIHERSSTITSIPFNELENWYTQGLIKAPVPAAESTVVPAAAKAIEKFDPTTPEGYAKVMGDPVLQDAYQDTLDALFGGRLVDVRNALRERGWEGLTHTLTYALGGSVHGVTHDIKHVGAGRNVVGITWSVDGGTSRIQDDLTKSADELAAQINNTAITLTTTPTDPVSELNLRLGVVQPSAEHGNQNRENKVQEGQRREIKVYIDGFRQFLPNGQPLDRDALMASIQPFMTGESTAVIVHGPKFLGSGAIRAFSLPEDAVLELDHDVLRISVSGYACEILATEPAPAFSEDRPWILRDYKRNAPLSFAGALASASSWLKENQAWEDKKGSYPDGGHKLDELATQYASFLHEKMPTHHDGSMSEMHRSFAIAIMDKNVDYLLGWIARSRGQNDLSKKYFTQATSCKLPSTIRDITAAIYAWAGFAPEQAAQVQAEKEVAREARLQARRIDDDIKWHGNTLSNSNVNHDGVIKTTKQFLDEIIDKGYTQIGKHQVGAAARYTLENPEIQRSYNIKGKMVDYARAVLAKRVEQKLELEVTEDELRPQHRP